MVAKNMAELERMLKRELLKAMNQAAGRILLDMQISIKEDFYADTHPIEYKRTHAMEDTPTISEIHNAGNMISFEAYLNSEHQYTTGKKPNMMQVLLLTNDEETNQPNIGYLRKAVGYPKYWEKALEEMEKTYYDVLGRYFTRI